VPWLQNYETVPELFLKKKKKKKKKKNEFYRDTLNRDEKEESHRRRMGVGQKQPFTARRQHPPKQPHHVWWWCTVGTTVAIAQLQGEGGSQVIPERQIEKSVSSDPTRRCMNTSNKNNKIHVYIQQSK
jgi:hypothetical protein